MFTTSILFMVSVDEMFTKSVTGFGYNLITLAVNSSFPKQPPRDIVTANRVGLSQEPTVCEA